MLAHPEYGPPLSGALHHEWINKQRLPGRLLDRFLAEFEHETWPGPEEVGTLLEDDEENRYIASLQFDKLEIENPEKIANNGIARILSRYCQPKIREIELEIARKREKFDAEVIALLQKVQELRRLKTNPPKLKALP